MGWEEVGKKARAKVLEDIPQEWRIPKDKLPPEDQLNVTGFPYSSGLLTETEIAITNALATDIVQQVASGTWTAESVARAFCKRAAIAHQLVSRNDATVVFDIVVKQLADQLLDGHHVRRSY